MKIEYYENMLEQEAINKYLNMIANDYNGELAKMFQEKYINKDKEIERLKEDNEYLNKVNIELSAEKNRLNNIINELENYIRARADDNYTCSVCSAMTDDLLNILKGENNE